MSIGFGGTSTGVGRPTTTGWCVRLNGDWSISVVIRRLQDPRGFVREYAREAIEKSDRWYAPEEVRGLPVG